MRIVIVCEDIQPSFGSFNDKPTYIVAFILIKSSSS